MIRLGHHLNHSSGDWHQGCLSERKGTSIKNTSQTERAKESLKSLLIEGKLHLQVLNSKAWQRHLFAGQIVSLYCRVWQTHLFAVNYRSNILVALYTYKVVIATKKKAEITLWGCCCRYIEYYQDLELNQP